ncbi:MAG: hypothetical protein J2P17_23605, partial [Mycobacterium sp.]|nr:hypothetical protein [Mycobacterium sp.]
MGGKSHRARGLADPQHVRPGRPGPGRANGLRLPLVDSPGGSGRMGRGGPGGGKVRAVCARASRSRCGHRARPGGA